MNIVRKKNVLLFIKSINANVRLEKEFIASFQKTINEYAMMVDQLPCVQQIACPSPGNFVIDMNRTNSYRVRTSLTVMTFSEIIECHVKTLLEACLIVMHHANRMTLRSADLDLVKLLFSDPPAFVECHLQDHTNCLCKEKQPRVKTSKFKRG